MPVRAIVVLIVTCLLGACAPFSGGPAGEWATSISAPPMHMAGLESAGAQGWGPATVIPTTLVVQSDDDISAHGRYLLDTGDKLRIFVYGQPNLSRIYTVDQQGFVSVPLIGNMKARGMTTVGLERSIRSKLGAQFVKDPQVTVDISQNRPFFILGEVRAAGQYPYVSGLTVQSAVAVAGGYSERANERRVQITRKTDEYVEKMDVPGDYMIQPGDTIYVYERWF
jgi:polysaccharide biosynthesis/export protein